MNTNTCVYILKGLTPVRLPFKEAMQWCVDVLDSVYNWFCCGYDWKCVLAKCNVVRSWRRVALVAWGCPHNHVKTDSMRLKNVQVASFWAWKGRPESFWRCLWDQKVGSPRPKCSQGRCAQFRQDIFGSKMRPNSVKNLAQKQDAEKEHEANIAKNCINIESKNGAGNQMCATCH